jgi:phosphopantetheinyl transferase
MESDEGLRALTTLLSPDEARLLRGFTYPKRRLEWLGGRLAAKHGLSGLLLTEPAPACRYRDLSLLPDASGRPVLHDFQPQGPIPAVSISHSRDYAAALVVATGDCGIDIQHKSAQLAKVQERFAAAEELALLHGIDDPHTRLGLLWTAKEAVKKCLLADQPTFFGRISLAGMTHQSEEAIWRAECRVTGPGECAVSVRIAAFGDYLIACTAGVGYA